MNGMFIQIECRNNLYRGKISILYDNTHPNPRKGIYNRQSIEDDIVSPNQMN